MYCTQCGVQMSDAVNFCAQCGTPTASNAYSAARPYPKLSRPREDRKIAGVCAGFARYMGVDVTLIRLIWLVMAICGVGLGVIAYVVAWAVMPNDPLRLSASPAVNLEPTNGHA
jgi:phage shock protein C